MSHDPLRFNLSALAVREKSVTLFFLLIIALAGLYAFFELGRAEDPPFSVRAMVVSVTWPGATAEQMQQQVADPLEKRIMEVAYFDKIESTSRPGLLTMQVTFEDFTPSQELPNLFYEVRKRMQDEAPRLPPGVQGPFVNDDFSDVYFSLYSLTAPGMPQRQLVREAERLRDRFNRVEGVQKVRLIGEQPARVFVDLDAYRLAQLGLNLQQIGDALEAYNRLLPAGLIETQGSRLYWRIDADLADLDAIRDVPLRVGERLIRLGDVAEVVRGYEDPPSYLVRAFGDDALLLGVVLRKGENGLDVGEHLANTYQELAEALPLGMELRQVTKFLIAVLVVMLVSFVSLGLRPGLIVGIAVPLTLGMTFLLMLMRGMNLDRITLGALIIALGLLVDDAIIAIEMMLVKMEEGWDKVRAAAHAWTVTAAPMLSGTLVTVIGFVPIGFAKSGVGEYTGNIFWVLAFALLASWFVAVVFTPWLGVALLKEIKAPHKDHAQAYNTRGYQRFRRLIGGCVRYRKSVVLATVGLFVLSVMAMGAVVQKQFFPSSDRPEVLVEVFMPEGSSIGATDAVARRVEALLEGHDELVSVSTYVGAGAPRFFLSLNPEQPNPGFAKLVIIARDAAGRDRLITELREHVAAGEFPEARVRVHQLVFGPPVVWPVSFRVMGPDTEVLRELSNQVRQVMSEHPAVSNANLDWSERVPVARLKLDNERLRAIGLTPRELSQQLQFQWGGMPATVLREDVRSVQLVMRGLPEGVKDFADLPLRTSDGRSITLQQAGLIEMVSEDPVLKRYNREPFITVQGDVQGAQPPDVTWALWEQLAPLGVIGATLALIIGNQPFGFVALLGLTGLAGILMRNTLILTMQIDDNLASGMDKFNALVEATVQRTRPVLLTALAAALAFVPLTHDAFWGPMAYVLIGGTLVGTLITLLFLPALYALWFRVVAPRQEAA